MIKKEIRGQEFYTAVGIMSGTSVDGLDIALCRFSFSAGRWNTEIIKTNTYSYDGTPWSSRLPGAMELGGLPLMELHRDFGRFTGERVKDFLDGVEEKPDIIASHGHTVFHQPGRGITLQIGDGAEIAAITGITTVSDFRRLDVALGGQGAPLVPIGDELLFGQYRYCLNLGGFANISFRESDKRVAFDLCPVNIVLNSLAQQLGFDYDDKGELARRGTIDINLLNALEMLDFYGLTGPRSLGREWVDEVFMPVLEKYYIPVGDKLRTVCEHIALRIASAVDNTGTLLITGGGAKNSFLTGLISGKVRPARSVIPESRLVDYKEAVIFAFLGVLRLRNEVNCLSSVTGARIDNSGGVIYLA